MKDMRQVGGKLGNGKENVDWKEGYTATKMKVW